jgi:hypothetical protein
MKPKTLRDRIDSFFSPGGRQARRSNRPSLSVDILEERTVLSASSLALAQAYSPPAAAMAGLTASNASSSGTVHKSPAFYEFYTGPKNRDLNVVSATVRLVPGKSLTLSGVMQGKIVKNPSSTDQQSFYVFGINRHSPSAMTPFFQRPGITFDAVVVVSVETSGLSASVTDLTNGTTTPIDPRNIHIAGKMVSVTVDPSLLPTPAGGVDLAHSSYNLWPRSDLNFAPQPYHGSSAASFIPEDGMAPIGVVGGGHRRGA